MKNTEKEKVGIAKQQYETLRLKEPFFKMRIKSSSVTSPTSTAKSPANNPLSLPTNMFPYQHLLAKGKA
ncbi:hypothetical protein IGJ48_001341 [Enterococcus pernyi]